jgi:hypothetical protein
LAAFRCLALPGCLHYLLLLPLALLALIFLVPALLGIAPFMISHYGRRPFRYLVSSEVRAACFSASVCPTLWR